MPLALHGLSQAIASPKLELGDPVTTRRRRGVEVSDLFDAQVSDIDHFRASRLPGEPAEGVNDLQVHTAEPRSLCLVAA